MNCHDYEVTCADISADGTLLATCSEDSLVVHEIGIPFREVCTRDLTDFKWLRVNKCEFNGAGSMLYVSGQCRKSPFAVKEQGEILVFSVLEKFQICARISTRPADAGGCWYGNKYVISAEFKWLAHFISTSMLWMNKITCLSSTSTNDYTLACMRPLFKFYNPGGNAVRQMLVANCTKNLLKPPTDSRAKSLDERLALSMAVKDFIAATVIPVPKSDCDLPPRVTDQLIRLSRDGVYRIDSLDDNDDDVDEEEETFDFTDEYHNLRFLANELGEDENWVFEDDSADNSDFDDEEQEWIYYDDSKEEDASEFLTVDDGFEVINEKDKLLIFTTGIQCSVPHAVGIRTMSQIRFRKHMDLSKSLKQRVEERKRRERQRQRERLPDNPEEETLTNWSDYPSVSHRFDHMDVLFDFHGRIMGLGLSPDSRFLYINYHPWPKMAKVNAASSDPPPIGTKLDCVVLELSTFDIVGKLVNRQEAFMANNLNHMAVPKVSKNYVGSPVDDTRARIFDRHYGVKVADLDHEDRVQCLALDGATESWAVTVGDDSKVKIWGSREKERRWKKKLEEN